jgi:hypothetical protein
MKFCVENLQCVLSVCMCVCGFIRIQ